MADEVKEPEAEKPAKRAAPKVIIQDTPVEVPADAMPALPASVRLEQEAGRAALERHKK